MNRYFVSVARYEEVCTQRDELIAQRDDALKMCSNSRATLRCLELTAEANARRVSLALAIIARMQRLADSSRETAALEELAAILNGTT
jgi:hypothetical protein